MCVVLYVCCLRCDLYVCCLRCVVLEVHFVWGPGTPLWYEASGEGEDWQQWTAQVKEEQGTTGIKV